MCGLQSADVELETWVKSLKEFLLKCDFPLPLRKGHDIQSIIKIKSRDSKYSDFKKSPLKNFFQLKIVDSYVRSSIHGVKGETFDAVLLCATKCKGNTITRSLLCSGKLDSEMMRTAYVAMTRPRKYLAIAMIMPKRQMDLKERFPQTKWEYIYIYKINLNLYEYKGYPKGVCYMHPLHTLSGETFIVSLYECRHKQAQHRRVNLSCCAF